MFTLNVTALWRMSYENVVNVDQTTAVGMTSRQDNYNLQQNEMKFKSINEECETQTVFRKGPAVAIHNLI